MSKENLIAVEVAYATATKQKIIALNVMPGCTVYQAAMQSGITAEFPEIILEQAEMGVFGKLEPHPKERLLISGDRIEIYRPLMIDPKESRKARAAQMKKEKQREKEKEKEKNKRPKRVRTTEFVKQ